MALTAGITAAARAETPPEQACAAEAARQEQSLAIPPQLVHAISLLESGRWDPERKASYAWPWTVTAEGQGRFLPTKAAAIAEVKALRARGVANIDVGCMQVNLHHHANAFANLDEAFDPAQNVGYAARFLVGLYKSTQSWPTAGAYYHSQTPHLAAAYKAKLMAMWDDQKSKTGKTMLAQVEARPPPASRPIPHADTRAPTLARYASDRDEARRIADAYRQARLQEWVLRKADQAAHAPARR